MSLSKLRDLGGEDFCYSLPLPNQLLEERPQLPRTNTFFDDLLFFFVGQ